MSEQRYRLEENNQTNELILWEDVKILNVFKSSYDNRKHLNIIVDCLNEQQSTISALKEENDILKQKLRKNYIANKQYEEMKRLQEENEQLKKEYKIAIDEMVTDYKKLEKENEQLKKKLESLQKVLHLVECVSDE